MGFLDDSNTSLSSSLSSHDEEFGGGVKTTKVTTTKQKRHTICNVPSVVEGDVEQRLSSIMSLKSELGMPDEETQEERIQRRLQERKAEKELEKEKTGGEPELDITDLAKMKDVDAAEESLASQRNSVSSMMDMIRQKRAQSMKNLAANESAGGTTTTTTTTKKKKDGLASSAHTPSRIPRNRRASTTGGPKPRIRRSVSSAGYQSYSELDTSSVYTNDTTTLDDDEKAELEKLKAKKERRKIRRSSSMKKNAPLRRTKTIG